jgi:DNA-binding response OmpR family regulator
MLLRFLIENVGVCVSRDQLINEVWKGIRIEARTIDSHISRLRKRLASSEVFIESVYGGGYIMS